jgi:hypothetical protein
MVRQLHVDYAGEDYSRSLLTPVFPGGCTAHVPFEDGNATLTRKSSEAYPCRRSRPYSDEL